MEKQSNRVICRAFGMVPSTRKGSVHVGQRGAWWPLGGAQEMVYWLGTNKKKCRLVRKVSWSLFLWVLKEMMELEEEHRGWEGVSVMSQGTKTEKGSGRDIPPAMPGTLLGNSQVWLGGPGDTADRRPWMPDCGIYFGSDEAVGRQRSWVLRDIMGI